MTKIRVDLEDWKKLESIKDEHYGESRRRTVLLGKVMDALDLRDAYPDVTTEVEELDYSNGSFNGMWPRRTVSYTTFGVSKFEADILAASDAARGEEALKRIRTALKGAKS